MSERFSKRRSTNAVAPDVRAVARLLGGDVIGADRVLAPGPGHSHKDRSLSVLLTPSAPDGLVVHSFAGDDPLACKDYVRRMLGMRTYGTAAHRLRRLQRGKTNRYPGKTSPAAVRDTGHHAKQLAKAQRLWRAGVPITGTPAERYLREARGYRGPLPATLRYLKPHRRDYHPAMVAAFGLAREPESGVLDITESEISGVHLTLINPEGTAKAGTGQDKRMVGQSVGSPIVLAPPNDLLGLVVCEGIEDALSMHAATGLGAWAAGAAGRLQALAAVVPNYIDCISIVADADATGQTNAAKLAIALRQRGSDVELKTFANDSNSRAGATR
jgi:hypothetical protein